MEIWIKWLKSLNKKYQQRGNDFLDTGKDKPSTIKIKRLEQTARNFTNFSDRKIPMWKTHQPKKKQRNFGQKFWKKGSKQWRSLFDQNKYQQHLNMEWTPINEMEVAEVLKTTLNLKAHGRHHIAHFCFQQLTARNAYLAALFNELIEVSQIPKLTIWMKSSHCVLILHIYFII